MLNNVSINNAHQLNIKSILLVDELSLRQRAQRFYVTRVINLYPEHIHIEYVV